MKFGDVVIYKEFGREYPALVVGFRELEHHGGAGDEPLVNLAFVREVKDGAGNVAAVSGTSRESELIQFRHDVAHETHEFTEDQKKELSDKGLLPPGGSIPGGRYVEASVSSAAAKSEQVVSSTEGEALPPEPPTPAEPTPEGEALPPEPPTPAEPTPTVQ